VAASAIGLPSLAQQTENEFWPEADVFVKLSENLRLFFLASGTRIEEQGNNDGSLGVHIDFFLCSRRGSNWRQSAPMSPAISFFR
jgi:hypothetical protein